MFIVKNFLGHKNYCLKTCRVTEFKSWKFVYLPLKSLIFLTASSISERNVVGFTIGSGLSFFTTESRGGGVGNCLSEIKITLF